MTPGAPSILVADWSMYQSAYHGDPHNLDQLGNVFPGFVTHDVMNILLIDAKHFGQLGTRNHKRLVKAPNFNDLFGCEFGQALVLSAWNALTVFAKHVVSVVSNCPKKKVIWIATAWIVALVQNKQSVGDRAICQHPGDTVRKIQLSCAPDIYTVTLFSSVASKGPAIRRTIDLNLGPKVIGAFSGCDKLRAHWNLLVPLSRLWTVQAVAGVFALPLQLTAIATLNQ